MTGGLSELDYLKCVSMGYTVDQIDKFGYKCRCGGVIMPIWDVWEETRQGRKCRVYGASINRCTECLDDSPVGGIDDYVEYL